jgi:hypothetical protein
MKYQCFVNVNSIEDLKSDIEGFKDLKIRINGK